NELRARVGLSPNRPHAAAGKRIEPPRSLACAMGTIPDATAAAEPPLDPLVERVVSQGLRAAPYIADSQVGTIPNSGVLVLPRMTSRARRRRMTSSESKVET